MADAPWFIGGGAEHSSETARLLAHAATSGAEGIITPGGYKVAPLAVPGGSVRVAPGAAAILNRYGGGSSQSYITRRAAETVVPIAPTSSAGGRTDLVVQRIDDPQYGGSLNPTDPAAVFDPIVVIQGVPAGTVSATELNLPYPAIALAKVTLPASTATVTAGTITDLRALANPRRERFLRTHQPSNEQTVPTASLSHWPIWEPTFRVPRWATHVVATLRGSGLRKPAGGLVIGDLRLELGIPGGLGATIGQSVFEVDANTQNLRTGVEVGGEYAIFNEGGQLRGIRLLAQRNAQLSASDGNLQAVTRSLFVLDVEFVERAV